MLAFVNKVQTFVLGILLTLGAFLGCVQQSHMKTLDPVMTPPTVSQADRNEEILRIKKAGLDGPSSGPVLAHPFKKPFTRRSFVVPARWFKAARENIKKNVMASQLLADLPHLEALMRMTYGGWDSARKQGHNWDVWFANWNASLKSKGDEILPLEVAFEPIKRLMDIQLDNHTNIMGLKTSSGSQSARLEHAAQQVCDQARHAGNKHFTLATNDKGQQPHKAHVLEDGRLVSINYIAYPSHRGAIEAVRCGDVWIKAVPVWSEPANTTELAGTVADVPVRRQLSDDVVVIRLPTFSKGNVDKLRAAIPKWPDRGKEKLVIVDLRNNGGGEMQPQALMPWVSKQAIRDSFKIKRTIGTSCLYHGLRWNFVIKEPWPNSMSERLTDSLQITLDALSEGSGTCERMFKKTPGKPMLARNFSPHSIPPRLRIVGLVNQHCGSDCEAMALVIAQLQNGLLVGTNTYGVMQYVQPGYFVLPNTRVAGRLALGTLDAYSDGRSLDGYGLNVDILLQTENEHSPEAIEQLATVLLGTQ